MADRYNHIPDNELLAHFYADGNQEWIGILLERSPRVIVAVPVGAAETCGEFADVTDETVCARTPAPFRAVGLWYRDFSETTDDEVRSLLRQHAGRLRTGGHRS